MPRLGQFMKMNLKTDSFAISYKNWLTKWAPTLWSLVCFQAPPTEDLESEFVEALRGTYYSLRIRGAKKDENSIAAAFIRVWAKLSAKNNFDGLWTWEERVLFLGLFRFSWTIDQLGFFLKKNSSHITMRTLDLLSRQIGGSAEDGKHLSRDCVSFDLFVIDCILKREWKDPLNFFTKEKLLQHETKCPRCKQFGRNLVAQIFSIRDLPLVQLDPKILDRIKLDQDSTSGWLAKNWLSQWPWYVKLPLQLVLASIVVFLILAIPYVGDLFPKPHKTTVKKEAEQMVRSEAPLPQVSPSPESTPVAVASPTPKVPIASSKQEKLLYTWWASADDFEGQGEKILAILNRHQAKQAGELGLGAVNRGGKYYHFSVKTEDLDSLKSEILSLEIKNFRETNASSNRKTPIEFRRVVFLLSPPKKHTGDSRVESVGAPKEDPIQNDSSSPKPSLEPAIEAQPSDPGSP